MKVIGLGATCAICSKMIQSGETYLTNWGDDNDCVHTTCNLNRLDIDQSNFSPSSGDLIRAAQAMGRKGGLVKSEAKTAAVRENGKKGGRPRKKETA